MDIAYTLTYPYSRSSNEKDFNMDKSVILIVFYVSLLVIVILYPELLRYLIYN